MTTKLKPYDAFETKAQAQREAKELRKEVQFVRIRKTTGRLKWVIYLGGRGSRTFV